MLSAIIFAFNITAPNLILMASGFLLKQKGVIDAGFVATASDIVFKVALPCLLFLSVLNSDIHFYAQLDLLLAGICTTFLLYFLAEIYAKFFLCRIFVIKAYSCKGCFAPIWRLSVLRP